MLHPTNRISESYEDSVVVFCRQTYARIVECRFPGVVLDSSSLSQCAGPSDVPHVDIAMNFIRRSKLSAQFLTLHPNPEVPVGENEAITIGRPRLSFTKGIFPRQMATQWAFFPEFSHCMVPLAGRRCRTQAPIGPVRQRKRPQGQGGVSNLVEIERPPC